MKRRRIIWVVLGLALANVGCVRKAKHKPYDVAPLQTNLRDGEAAAIAKQVNIAHLGQLPLYDLKWQLDLVDKRELKATGRIHYFNDTGKALDALPLLLHPNAPRELGVKDSGRIEVTSVKVVHGPAAKLIKRRPTLAVLRFSRALAPKSWVVFDIRYKAELRFIPASNNDLIEQSANSNMDLTSATASDYGLLARGDGIATLATTYPMIAPYRGGQFDTSKPTRFGDLAYNNLANFRLALSTPGQQARVFANLEQVSGKANSWQGVGAALRDLVVVVGKDLKQSETVVDGIKVSSVYLSRDEAAGQRVLKSTADSLKLYQQRFGRYPFKQLRSVESTLVGGAGGVEFPSMVLLAAMLYRKPSESTSMTMLLIKGALFLIPNKKALPVKPLEFLDQLVATMLDFVVAHEVAHQYFAAIVGSDSREDPVIDEPMAQFAAGEYMRAKYGVTEGQRLMDLNVMLNFGAYRWLGGKDMVAAQPVRKFPSMLAYAAMVYGKAPYFYVALRDAVGQEALNAALKKAVELNRFRLVTTKGWLDTLRKELGKKHVDRLAKRYLYGVFGDQDLGITGDLDRAVGIIVGPSLWARAKQGLQSIGMDAGALLKRARDDMNKLGKTSGSGGSLLDRIKSLQR